MAFEEKKYLDYAGLKKYDVLIKELINNNKNEAALELQNLINLIGSNKLPDGGKTLLERLDTIEANVGNIDELGSEVDTLVKAIVGEAARATAAEEKLAQDFDKKLDELLGVGVREDLNSLKEIVELLAGNETIEGLKNIVARLNGHDEEIAANKEAIKDVEAHVDAVEAKVDSFVRISEAEINFLFLEEVKVKEGKSVQETINTLQEGQKLVLDANVAEDVIIPASAVIDANGKEFEGNVEVAKGAHILNAVFKNPVVVK